MPISALMNTAVAAGIAFQATSATAAEGSSEWSYDVSDTTHGPSKWGGDCQTGKKQSPINIITSSQMISTTLKALKGDWPNVTASKLTNNGHAILVTPTSPSPVIGHPNPLKPDTDYKLLQFHFHYPSEHTISGVHKAAEVHFVHQNPTDSSLSVVGFLFEIGTESELLKTLNWNDLPGKDSTTEKTISATVSLSKLVDWSTTNYVTYEGSLTTPPCSEGVRWVVVTDVQTMSQEQLNQLRTAFGEGATGATIIGSARPIQNSSGRTISMFNASTPAAASGVVGALSSMLMMFIPLLTSRIL